MKQVELTCIHCGAKIQADADAKKVICEYCSSEMTYDGKELKDVSGEGEKSKFDWKKELRDWLIIIVAAFILAYALTHFVIIKTEPDSTK